MSVMMMHLNEQEDIDVDDRLHLHHVAHASVYDRHHHEVANARVGDHHHAAIVRVDDHHRHRYFDRHYHRVLYL
jgi:hypothetical protein